MGTLTPRARTYNSWKTMVLRCTDPGRNVYHLYDGRGITFCERWLNSIR